METSMIQNMILRIMAFVLLLISLIVMVTSKASSDSLTYRFQDFMQFRYVVAANVLGLAYSFLGIIQGLIGFSGGFFFYFNFILDQVMAYILLSSASVGIGCIMLTKDFVKGAELYDAAGKKFMRYASASVSIELVAFLVMAACAVRSSYRLSCYLYSATMNSVPRQGVPAPYIDTKQQGGVP